MIVDGRHVDLRSPAAALRAGIGIVHQELAACENLSVAENLCLGRMPVRRFFVDAREMERRARAMLALIENAGAGAGDGQAASTCTVRSASCRSGSSRWCRSPPPWAAARA